MACLTLFCVFNPFLPIFNPFLPLFNPFLPLPFNPFLSLFKPLNPTQWRRLVSDLLVSIFIFVVVTALTVTSVFCRSVVSEAPSHPHTPHSHRTLTHHTHTPHSHTTLTHRTHTAHSHTTLTPHSHTTLTPHTHTPHSHTTLTHHTHTPHTDTPDPGVCCVWSDVCDGGSQSLHHPPRPQGDAVALLCRTHRQGLRVGLLRGPRWVWPSST